MKKYLLIVFVPAIVLLIQSSCQEVSYNQMNVRNIIFFIGDGMGIVQSNAVRLQKFGKDARMNIDKFPVTGIVRTHSADDIITDSAASATAMSTGFKTKNRMLGMSPDSLAVKSILEAAQEKGYLTGLVATSGITHATPAGFASHVDSRYKYEQIATQMIGHKVDVLLGGGLEYFIPQSAKNSRRTDTLNLTVKAKKMGYDVVFTKEQMAASSGSKILGLFNSEGLLHEAHEPTLAGMTKKALDILSKAQKGFFIMVEGSQIDWACHDNDFEYMQREVLDFDEAIGVARQFADQHPGTLIVVTADHETGGMVINDGEEKNVDIRWASTHHSGTPVVIYAEGPHAIEFTGVLDNTDIAKKMGKLLGLKNFPGLLSK